MQTTWRPSAMLGVALLAGALVVPAPSQAADVGIDLHVGTLGAGLGVGFGLSDRWNARVGFNALTVEEDFSENNVDYEADLELQSFHALADWHPFGGGLRLTGGIVGNNNELTGSATIDGDETIGGRDVPNNASGRIGATVSFDDAAPYLGIGWGNQIRGWGPIAFTADLGVLMQGEPNVDLREEEDIPGITEQDVENEEANVEDELSDFDVYPVLSVGLVYRF